MSPALIGRKISRYEVLKKIGQGGMGEVYLAQDSRLNRRVALKFLAPRLVGDPRFRNRFMLEARAAAAVDHPYVCKIYEVEQVGNDLFLVLEFVEGQTLQVRMAERRIQVPDVLRLMCEIAEALAEAHRNNVIHRDIKPGNIMLTRNDHVKVMDFGLAKHHVVRAGGSTWLSDAPSESGVMGTPRYMAPEQTVGETDGRSDIFSLGIVLYEMAAGIHPFERDTAEHTMRALVNDKHVPLTQSAPAFPAAVGAMLDRMLAKSREARVGSMQEVWQEFGRLLGGAELRTALKKSDLTIAVLPFRDLSPEKDQEYFCDGLVEELINGLAQVRGMRVVPRTSVFRFKNQVTDLRDVALQLEASALLEGSVRKAGPRVRVTVNLISGESGYPIWSERYDAVLQEIFDIQDNITRTITEKLRSTFSHAAVTLPAGGVVPVDIEVYDQYLRGLYCWNERTADALKQSVRYFENAVAADPRYVPALAALANAHVTRNLYGVVNPGEAMPRAKDAADRALALNSKSAGALTARACLRAIYNWDWAAAEKDFQAAIQADPKYALAHHWYANNLLIPLGRFDEARNEIRLAAEIDPEAPAIAVSKGLVCYVERRYLQAIDEYMKAIQLDPGFGMAHYFLGQAYIQAKAYSHAIDSLQLASTLTNGSPEALSLLGYAHAASANMPAARDCLSDLLHEAKTKFVSPVLMAQICTGLGSTDEALAYLDQAVEVRAADLIWLNVRPAFDPIRSHERFKEICSRMGF